MGNASSILEMRGAAVGGFGGGGPENFSWAAVEKFSAASCTKLRFEPGAGQDVTVSGGGCTATNVGDCLAVVVAFTGDVQGCSAGGMGALPEGSQFEVTADSKSDVSAQYTVGLVQEHAKAGLHTLERMWGYSSSGGHCCCSFLASWPYV